MKISLLNKTKKDENSESWIEVKINTWHPNIGDKIEGTLVQVNRNKNQTIYVIETENGKKIQVWGKIYLDQLMDEIKVGDYIRITYNGFKTTKNNRKMKKYNVEMRL